MLMCKFVLFCAVVGMLPDQGQVEGFFTTITVRGNHKTLQHYCIIHRGWCAKEDYRTRTVLHFLELEKLNHPKPTCTHRCHKYKNKDCTFAVSNKQTGECQLYTKQPLARRWFTQEGCAKDSIVTECAPFTGDQRSRIQDNGVHNDGIQEYTIGDFLKDRESMIVTDEIHPDGPVYVKKWKIDGTLVPMDQCNRY